MAGIDDILLALADPTRRHMVDLLGVRPMRPAELASAFHISSPAMSRHLRVLRLSGLVEEQRADRDDARIRIYRLRREPFVQLRDWLASVEAFWADQLSAFKTHIEQTKKGRSH